MTPAPLRHPVNPLHAILLGFPSALFVSAALADIAYLRTAEIQWSNFAAWLNAGGLIFGAAVVALAIIGLLRARWRGAPLSYLLLLTAMWVLGLFNAFIHGRDAWFSVTATGMILSTVTALLALAAAWIGYRGFDRGEGR